MFSSLWLVILGILAGSVALMRAAAKIKACDGLEANDKKKKEASAALSFLSGSLVILVCCIALFNWNLSKVGKPSDLYAEFSYKVISRTKIGADIYLVNLQEVPSGDYYCIKTQSRLTPTAGFAHIAKIAGVWDLVEVETSTKTSETPKP